MAIPRFAVNELNAEGKLLNLSFLPRANADDTFEYYISVANTSVAKAMD